jgi:hypothetical protein
MHPFGNHTSPDSLRAIGGAPEPSEGPTANIEHRPRWSRRRPTPSIVIASVAVFAALSGTATAAKLITGKDIARSTITGKHVKNGSLTPADFNGPMIGPQGPEGPRGMTGPRGPVGAAGDDGPKGDQGPKGDKGDKGEQGERGPQGSPGKDGLNGKDGANGSNGFATVRFVSKLVDINPGQVGAATVACPPEAPRVISGGLNAMQPDDGWAHWHSTRVVLSYPENPGAWTAYGQNTSSKPLRTEVIAVCVNG